MGNWSLAVQGFTGDIAKVEEIIGSLKNLFGDPATGTSYSNFSHNGVEAPNFHLDVTPPADLPSQQEAPAEQTPAEEAAGQATSTP